MLDPKLLRTDLASVAERLSRRGYVLDTKAFTALESQRKKLQIESESLQSERNSKSKGIGKAKAQGEDVQSMLDDVATLGSKLDAAKSDLHSVQDKLTDLLMGIPNLPYCASCQRLR